MGEYSRLFKFNLLLFWLISSFSWGQLTDLKFDEVRVNGNLPPHEFCQGEVPLFRLVFRLEAGSATLTISSTNTLDIIAIGSGANSFTYTVTNVTNTLDGGNTIGTVISEAFNWPTSGSKSINLVNPGLTNIIFKISINSTDFFDPDDPDSAVFTASA